jgi:hypothetical protein
MNCKLKFPTVKDMIDGLSKYPKDMKLIICDPDTGWDVNIIHIEVYDGKLTLGGCYSEMNSVEVKP